MLRESDEFQSIFPAMRYLDGDMKSDFDPTQPVEYVAKLFQVRRTKKKSVVVMQVPLEAHSLNYRDCFILDNGLVLYVWCGEDSCLSAIHDCNDVAASIVSDRAC